MQLKPSPILSNIVKHYLIIACEATVDTNYRIFSDGNPGMVFHFKNPLLQFKADGLKADLQPKSFIYGQISNYINLISNQGIAMLVVVLQPHAILSLFNVAAHELLNATVNLADILGAEAAGLQEDVTDAHCAIDAIAVIEHFLIKQLAKQRRPDLNLLLALNEIYRQGGNITIDNLLKTLPVTERQLERKFKEGIGISPQKMAGIVRLQSFLKGLQKQLTGDNITSLSYNCGYYDQAHLNNYFKRHTGVTPLQYKVNNQMLALNLMMVSR